jgi:hypothetical protein
MTNAHTPTPWSIEDDYHVMGSDGDQVTHTTQANAALIVRAVNSYEAMRQALEGALQELIRLDANYTNNGLPNPVVQGIRKALALTTNQDGKAVQK